MIVHQAIHDHMARIAHFLLFQHILSSHTSVQSYNIENSRMNVCGTWVSELEILTLAHMLQTDIYLLQYLYDSDTISV